MPNPSRLCTNIICFVTFLYLVCFSILNNLYLHKNPHLDPPQPGQYDYENVAVNQVGCAFSISGYYARTPRIICYLLLVSTIVIRRHKWLAAGAAASVLTYSGVAAIHLIILFATNRRGHLPESKLHCEKLPVPGNSTSFVACVGVTDPDVSLSMSIVVTVMLGALPTVAWSKTFKKSTSKLILLLWLLLLAVAHTLYAVTLVNPRHSFQICPKGYIEDLPMANFQAPLLNQAWNDSFSSLVSAAQQFSQSPRSSSPPACIYSCFATPGYVGRKTQDIRVWDMVAVKNPILKNGTAHRRGGIALWWIYTLLVFLTLFITEKTERLPQFMKKQLSSISYLQALRRKWKALRPKWKALRRIWKALRWIWKALRWIWKIVTNIAIKRTKDSSITTDSSEATTSVEITVLKVTQLFTQVVSAVIFCGCVINQETQNAHAWRALSRDSFKSVGQWSNLAVVLLVLFAAVIGRIFAEPRAGRAAAADEERIGTRAGSAVAEEEDEEGIGLGAGSAVAEEDEERIGTRAGSAVAEEEDKEGISPGAPGAVVDEEENGIELRTMGMAQDDPHFQRAFPQGASSQTQSERLLGGNPERSDD